MDYTVRRWVWDERLRRERLATFRLGDARSADGLGRWAESRHPTAWESPERVMMRGDDAVGLSAVRPMGAGDMTVTEGPKKVRRKRSPVRRYDVVGLTADGKYPYGAKHKNIGGGRTAYVALVLERPGRRFGGVVRTTPKAPKVVEGPRLTQAELDRDALRRVSEALGRTVHVIGNVE